MSLVKDALKSLTGLVLCSSGQTERDEVDAIVITPTANNAAADILTITNAAQSGAATLTIPDLAGVNSTVAVTTNSPSASTSTITAAAGASNVSNVTITLKDAAGNALTGIRKFKVYASSASNGLTLASAASTGFAVSAGGLSLANGTAVTTQIEAMSSATGTCTLTLTDTAKQTSYLVLVLPDGKAVISAQLSSGSYG